MANLGKLFVGGGVVGKVDYTKNPVTVKLNTKPSAFGGKFDEVHAGMYITRVLYNDPVTVVFFSDGTKTTCKCQKGDTYNKEMGLAICVLKRLTSGDQVAALFNSWITKDKAIDLKMVREYAKDPIEVKEKETKAK